MIKLDFSHPNMRERWYYKSCFPTLEKINFFQLHSKLPWSLQARDEPDLAPRLRLPFHLCLPFPPRPSVRRVRRQIRERRRRGRGGGRLLPETPVQIKQVSMLWFQKSVPPISLVSPGLKTGESLQLAFTHVGGFAEKEGEENIFSCYFWCTREGEMPSIGDNGGGGGLLEAAVLVLHNNLLLSSQIVNSFLARRGL